MSAEEVGQVVSHDKDNDDVDKISWITGMKESEETIIDPLVCENYRRCRQTP